MSYNGIGLTTPRGSGTNGYVQRNLSFIRRRTDYSQMQEFKPPPPKKPNKLILEHERKRRVEVKCLKYRETMKGQGVPTDEVEERVNAYREEMLSRKEERTGKLKESHEIWAAKAKEDKRLREAFGIDESHQVGKAFDQDLQEKEKEERMAVRNAKMKPEERIKAAMTNRFLDRTQRSIRERERSPEVDSDSDRRARRRDGRRDHSWDRVDRRRDDRGRYHSYYSREKDKDWIRDEDRIHDRVREKSRKSRSNSKSRNRSKWSQSRSSDRDNQSSKKAFKDCRDSKKIPKPSKIKKSPRKFSHEQQLSESPICRIKKCQPTKLKHSESMDSECVWQSKAQKAKGIYSKKSKYSKSRNLELLERNLDYGKDSDSFSA